MKKTMKKRVFYLKKLIKYNKYNNKKSKNNIDRV